MRCRMRAGKNCALRRVARGIFQREFSFTIRGRLLLLAAENIRRHRARLRSRRRDIDFRDHRNSYRRQAGAVIAGLILQRKWQTNFSERCICGHGKFRAHHKLFCVNRKRLVRKRKLQICSFRIQRLLFLDSRWQLRRQIRRDQIIFLNFVRVHMKSRHDSHHHADLKCVAARNRLKRYIRFWTGDRGSCGQRTLRECERRVRETRTANQRRCEN